MSGRPRTACRICKSQKIRCSGEKPACKRCVRLKNKCTYESLDVTPRIVKELRQDHQSSFTGIPRTLLLQLIDTYHENVPNASLLFHKASFIESVNSETMVPHVILSICALAANFYKDGDSHPSLRRQGFAVEWARRAGKLAFLEIEEFSKDLIVTFLNLTLFWYSQGSWRVSSLYKANAFHSICTHGIGHVQGQQASWQTELQRRHFWAWYIMHCHNTENLGALAQVRDLQSLPLPWPEEDFAARAMRNTDTTLVSAEGSSSIFAEMIKILTLWSHAIQLIQCHQTSLTSDRVAKLYALDEQVSLWWRSLPVGFKLDPISLKAVPVAELPRILLTNLVYHQTLCVLHASVVPLFCWSPGDEGWSSVRHFSAQVAYENACAVAALIDATISSYPRLSAMPTFVAYAAYGGCAILIPFMWCSNPVVRHQAQRYVQSNIQIIHIMAEYWKFAALLTIHVRCLYNIHKKNPPALGNEPKYMDVHKLTEFRIEALYARVSILQFLGILQRDQSSFIEAGEETTDLGIKPSQEDHSVAMNRAASAGVPDLAFTTQSAVHWDPSSPQIDHLPDDLPSLMQSQQWNLIPPSDQGSSTWPSMHDVDVNEFLTSGETAGFGHSAFDFEHLDIDGWNFDFASLS